MTAPIDLSRESEALGEIQVLLNAGRTASEIARIMGVTRWVVLHRIRRGGLTMPPKRGRHMDAERHREVMRLLETTNLSHREIARRVGCSQHAVSYRGRKLRERAKIRLLTAGEFQPKKTSEPKVCPKHGRVHVWPCVACAAEAARRKHN